MSEKFKILLTNDDGIDAPGLYHLGLALQNFGELYVVAPETEKSATSRAITYREPLKALPTQVPFSNHACYAVSGTPADCSKLALNRLLGFRPDFVVSGINWGGNLGVDVHYSGTVGAAFEAATLGIPSLALSLAVSWGGDPLWEDCQKMAQRLLTSFITKEMAKRPLFLNINFPNLDHQEVEGIRWVPLGQSHYEDCYQETEDPHGHQRYWLKGNLVLGPDAHNSDQGVRTGKFISITPISLDTTDYESLRNFADDRSIKY